MFVCNRVQVKGHDGTGIPLTLVHKKGLPLSSEYALALWPYSARRGSMAVHDFFLFLFLSFPFHLAIPP
jgi:protease II